MRSVSPSSQLIASRDIDRKKGSSTSNFSQKSFMIGFVSFFFPGGKKGILRG